MLIHGNDGNIDSPETRIPHKVPKRILHFSDGTLEEYSTDEEESDYTEEAHCSPVIVDPSTLTWGPWMYHHTATAGSKALAACDYVGEALANFLGILQSKYQYEIDEFNRLEAEEKEARKQYDLEMGGWTENQTMDETTSQQPARIIA